MQLNPPIPAIPADNWGFDRIRQCIITGQDDLAAIVAGYLELSRDHATADRLRGAMLNAERHRHQEEAEQTLTTARETGMTAVADLQDRHQRRRQWLERLVDRRRRQLRERREMAVRGWEEELARAKDQLVDREDDERAWKDQRMIRYQEHLAIFQREIDELDGTLERLGRRHGSAIDGPRAGAEVGAVGTGRLSPEAALSMIDARIDALRVALHDLGESGDHRNAGLVTRLVNHGVWFLLVALSGAAVFFFAPSITLSSWYGLLAIPVWLLGAFILRTIHAGCRRRSGKYMATIRADRADLPDFIKHQEAQVRRYLRPEEAIESRVVRILGLEEKVEKKISEATRLGGEALERLRDRASALQARIDQGFETRIQRLQASTAQRCHLLAEALVRCQEDLADSAADAEQQSRRRLADERDTLSARWQQTHAALLALADALCTARDQQQPAWSAAAWSTWSPSTTYPMAVPLGRLTAAPTDLVTDLPDEVPPPPERTSIDLPLALAFPDRGHLLLTPDNGGREEAVALLRGIMLRLLAAFPPGKARFTCVDPVGLGESFSAFMRLADHDESLIGARIWTDANQIETRLAELTGHVEKVIQKYLRGRYATVAEYNAAAGVMQEPYRFLVIADFPTGFSDLALERLAGLLASGARCGVFVLIAHDPRQPWPAGCDPAMLTRSGLVLEPADGALRPADPALAAWRFLPDAPPTTERIEHLLGRIGDLAVNASRVEVPFASVAPTTDQRWTASAAAGLRVPVGRAGADRLQYLDLGRGTAQHALIGGRTGSGKSTLFHVLIANAALWFSPDEVRFFLIDFKKGVEFKPFATHDLPHAQVIAIESDREFGLSVLQGLNRELARRGERFRAAGTQDLAAFRAVDPEIMPRLLLVIDEFQEFFSDDDVIARDAAMLLDRFVRQGRAFGIHVVLGSQTLGGFYNLAKSTVGQMGVRIALQCNEADSHLILSEDNDAARLLTRPGDAIYNDLSGLPDGNSPFQVVWLPEAEEAKHLTAIAALATDRTWTSPEPTVVYEGNQPVFLSANRRLADLMAQPWSDDQAQARAWIGEPNAIKSATEVHLVANAAGNLAIIGRNREAAFAIITAIVIGLAARLRPDVLRLLVLNGESTEPDFADCLDRLTTTIPGRLEQIVPAALGDRIESLHADLMARRDAGAPTPTTVLFVFSLHRFRALRREDDYGFGSGDAMSTGDRFALLLQEGSEHGIHVVTWCDSLANLTRSCGRQALKNFATRILFQMSAADSSEVMDETAANTLGLHHALLYDETGGTVEKFRPYDLPHGDWLNRLRKQFRVRFG